MKKYYDLLLAGILTLAGTASLVAVTASCGGSDPAPAPSPATSSVTVKLDSLPAGSTITTTTETIKGGIEGGPKTKVGDVEAGWTLGANGEYTKTTQTIVFGNGQLTPIATLLAPVQQATTTPRPQVVQPVPVNDQYLVCSSGRVIVPQMDQATVDAINAGGAPISIFFAFPFGNDAALAAAEIDSFGIRVYDGNGVLLPNSTWANTKLVSAPMSTWPKTAPINPNPEFPSFVMWWLNNDDTPVRPDQLGLLSGSRQFEVVVSTTKLDSSYKFAQGMGLWHYRTKTGQDVGTGIWVGWHGAQWGADYSDCTQPTITAVQDSRGNYITSFASGDIIKVIVDGGYDLPASYFQIANTNFDTAVGVVAGPGPDERTYTLIVPDGVGAGPTWLLFRNKGATPVWNPSQIGSQCASVTSAAVTVN